MLRRKKPTTIPEVESPESQSLESQAEPEAGNTAPAPAPVHAHNHFCEVCLQPVAHCAGPCQHEGPQYCSVHHPDPEHRVPDKPTVRMHVKIAE